MSGVTIPGSRFFIFLIFWGGSACALALPSGHPTPAESFPEPFAQHKVPLIFRPELRPEEVLASAVPGNEDNVELVSDTPPSSIPPSISPRKKRKKLSPINRLRQLYFLPLLHPLGGRY